MLAYILITLEDANEKKILESITKNKEVREAHILFGEWDIIIKVEIENAEDLARFVMEKIRSIKGVKLTSTLISAR
ncbi:MAG: Lrp/AsnC ligand binding domain-containing protein [Candidatus Woesearchaeota archaeon]